MTHNMHISEHPVDMFMMMVIIRHIIVNVNIVIYGGVGFLLLLWMLGWRGEGGGDVVLLWWTKGFPGTSQYRHCSAGVKCKVVSDTSAAGDHIDGYLFYGSNIEFDVLPLPRKGGVMWALYHEESPRNVEELMHESVLRLFNVSATFSQHSDAPFPLQHLDSMRDVTTMKYYVPTARKNQYLETLAPILYLQSDCETATERDEYARELMKVMRVDSYGTCLNNAHLPHNLKRDYLNRLNESDFLEFVANYKFTLAIENGVCDDYITEKLWRAIKVGSVPIYFGAPNVRDWLPNNKSAILLQQHSTVAGLAAHLRTLLTDDEAYEAHLEHKLLSRVTNARLAHELHHRPWAADALATAERLECELCEAVHARTRRVVTAAHYHCPAPHSALTQAVRADNDWVRSWRTAGHNAQQIYDRVRVATEL